MCIQQDPFFAPARTIPQEPVDSGPYRQGRIKTQAIDEQSVRLSEKQEKEGATCTTAIAKPTSLCPSLRSPSRSRGRRPECSSEVIRSTGSQPKASSNTTLAQRQVFQSLGPGPCVMLMTV